MSPRIFFLIVAALSNIAVGISALVAAEPAPTSGTVVTSSIRPASASSSFTYSPENLTSDLTQQLTDRYRVNGELQVDLLRAWTPPRAVAEPIAFTLLEAPSTLSSTLLIRFRLQA